MQMKMRRVATVLLVAMLTGAVRARAQSCENPRPTLGIGTYHCQGGSCLVSRSSSTVHSYAPPETQELRERYPFPYSFTVEPRLWEVEHDGPAAGRVRDGDLLIAVNAAPITTRRAALELTNMKPGEDMVLTLRRDDRVLDVRIEVEETCEAITASAGPDEIPWTLRRDRREPVPSAPELPSGSGLVRLEAVGLVLAGEKHIRVDAGGAQSWWFEGVPVVAEVVAGSPADHAGILAGEELVSVGGDWVTTPEGAKALAGLRAGDGIQVIVRRGNSARGVTINGR